MPRLMLVDDDVKFRDVMHKLLSGYGLEISCFSDGNEAIQALSVSPPDILICDIYMKPVSGMDVLNAAMAAHPNLPVIMLTAYGTMETALECLRAGAFDYLTKPFRIPELVETIERALAWDSAQSGENPHVPYLLGGNSLVGASRSMRELGTMIERVAPADATVLFRGERGVGKQTAGRAVHALSPRRAGPFIVADCTGRTEEQLIIELFGAQPGAAPGVKGECRGLIRDADAGTLWLNEIGAMPLGVQERILRLFREQVIQPLGATATVPANVRVLAETSLNIERNVGEGKFRPELFARFAPIALEIKPLRERREDIIPLVWHFCRHVLGEKAAMPRIEPGARGLLLHYNWPGNVSELEAVIQTILKPGPVTVITSQNLPATLIQTVSGMPASAVALPELAEDSGRGKALKAFLRAEEAKLAKQSQTTDNREKGNNI